MAAGGSVFCRVNNASSNLTPFLPNQTSPSTSLFLSPSLGSRSMVSFEDVNGGGKGCNGVFFRHYDADENGDDEEMDEYFHHQPEKKRRLSVEQVRFLEKSFDEENKLEPDRKTRLAQELGLQPRQVAIWFQNRRARWKTKRLEKDYDSLQASYDELKASYDNLLREKDKLNTEVASLTEMVLGREAQEGNFETNGILQEPLQKMPLVDSASEGEGSKVSVAGGCKQEDISSAKSDMFDSDSPHYTDGVHSALLETGDSSYAFEPDQSDVSQDEEDNLSKILLPPYIFPKLEDVDYSDPPHGSCSFGFQEEDQAIWSWPY